MRVLATKEGRSWRLPASRLVGYEVREPGERTRGKAEKARAVETREGMMGWREPRSGWLGVVGRGEGRGGGGGRGEGLRRNVQTRQG